VFEARHFGLFHWLVVVILMSLWFLTAAVATLIVLSKLLGEVSFDASTFWSSLIMAVFFWGVFLATLLCYCFRFPRQVKLIGDRISINCPCTRIELPLSQVEICEMPWWSQLGHGAWRGFTIRSAGQAFYIERNSFPEGPGLLERLKRRYPALKCPSVLRSLWTVDDLNSQTRQLIATLNELRTTLENARHRLKEQQDPKRIAEHSREDEKNR